MHKFKVWDTVFWGDPRGGGTLAGDYTVTGISGEMLMLSDDSEVDVEVPASECTHRDWYDADFPNWALSYFVNGDSSALTEEEIREVDTWVDGMRRDGYVDETITDDTNEFCAHPAFGLGSDTTRVRFYKKMRQDGDADEQAGEKTRNEENSKL